MDTAVELREHTIDLWSCADPAITDTELLGRYDALLEPHERERQQRFAFAEDRHQYLVTRALVRNVLSLYVPTIAPAEWRFARREHGKPWVVAPLPDVVRFNLSHTRGRIVLAVTRSVEVGVDVETEGRAVPFEIASDHFAACEAEDLFRLPEARRKARFYELWTLKEAYLKASGGGLTVPLSNFSLNLACDAGIELRAGGKREANGRGRWDLWLLRAAPEYVVAVALDRMNAEVQPFALEVRGIVPGQWHGPIDWPIVRRSQDPRGS